MKCPLCMKREANTKDHILPRGAGGTNKKSNIQPLCYRCNQLKNKLFDGPLIKMSKGLYKDKLLDIFRKGD